MKISEPLSVILGLLLSVSAAYSQSYRPLPNTTYDQGIPFAKIHGDLAKGGKIVPIDSLVTGLDIWNTVNPRVDGASIADKDNASRMAKLGYVTNQLETKNFAGQIGTFNQKGDFKMAVLVDDVATVTITDKSGAKKSYTSTKGALWRKNHVYIVPFTFVPKELYTIKIEYKNTGALKHPDNKVDVDGISVYYYQNKNTPKGTLTIDHVPEFVFACAKYRVPIRFTINDVEKAQIHAIQVYFHPYDGAEPIEYVTYDKFTADFGVTQSNGTTNSYAVYIDEDNFFDSIDLKYFGGVMKDSAYFTLDVLYRGVDKDGKVDDVLTTAFSTDRTEGLVTNFADKSHNAYDVPMKRNAYPKIEYESDSNKHLISEGERKSTTWIHYGFDIEDLKVENAVATAFVPGHDAPSSSDRNYAYASSLFNGPGTYENENGTDIKARLYDDNDMYLTSPEGDTTTGVYDYRRGSSFFLSYGGRKVNVTKTPVMACGLPSGNVEQGDFEFRLFEKLYSEHQYVKQGDGITDLVKIAKFLAVNAPGIVGSFANVFKVIDGDWEIDKTVKGFNTLHAEILKNYKKFGGEIKAPAPGKRSGSGQVFHSIHMQYPDNPKPFTDHYTLSEMAKGKSTHNLKTIEISKSSVIVGTQISQWVYASSIVSVWTKTRAHFGATTHTRLKAFGGGQATAKEDWEKAIIIMKPPKSK